jgi:predicted amidophosphoribosyltransferase
MSPREKSALEVTCPCCGARLKVDAELGKVVHHTPPPRHAKAPDIDHASQLLEKEKARREALFQQSSEDTKTKSQLLERKFEEALKQTKDEPVTRPTRDIDLD